MANVARALCDTSGGEERVTEDIGPVVPAHGPMVPARGPSTRNTSDVQGVSGKSGTNSVRTGFVPVRWPMIVGGVLAGIAATALVIFASETPRATPETPRATPETPRATPATPDVPAAMPPAAMRPSATPAIDAGVSGVEKAKSESVERKRARPKSSTKKTSTTPATTKRKTRQGETLD
jgi:hypothetical protein